MSKSPEELLAEINGKINVINSLSPRPFLVKLDPSTEEVSLSDLVIESGILSSILEGIKTRLSTENILP
jgi:hypothetical protein